MNRSIELIFCMLIQIQETKSYFNNYWMGVNKSGCDLHDTLKFVLTQEWFHELSRFFACWCNFLKVTFLSWGSKFYCMKNELMNWTDFLHTGINSGKLKITSIITGWVWSKISASYMVPWKLLYLKNELLNCTGFIHADTNPRKVELNLIIIRETSNLSMAF